MNEKTQLWHLGDVRLNLSTKTTLCGQIMHGPWYAAATKELGGSTQGNWQHVSSVQRTYKMTGERWRAWNLHIAKSKTAQFVLTIALPCLQSALHYKLPTKGSTEKNVNNMYFILIFIWNTFMVIIFDKIYVIEITHASYYHHQQQQH
jgi:hypothetical protein